jgi:hypothetical protein
MAAMSCPQPLPKQQRWAKEDDNNGLAGSIGCGDHFGGVGALMGSGAMTTMTTKIDNGARPPQVVIVV